jgi:hypothetical protein
MIHPRRRTVTVVLGEFAREALEDGPSGSSARLSQAIRYYLADRDSERPGWPFPGLGRGDPSQPVGIDVDVDGSVWDELCGEADRQGVAVDRLLEHAVLYLTADRDSGRLAERIVDDLSADG